MILKYFDIKELNIKQKDAIITKHSDFINENNKGYLLIRTDFINSKIIEKIEKKQIIGIIGNNECVKLYKNFDIEVINVENADFVWSLLCFKNFPNAPKNKIAITGTNGKTSTTLFISTILNKMNIDNLLINSLGIFINGTLVEKTNNTTPDAFFIHKWLNEFSLKFPNGFAIIETTSIAIEHFRTHFLHFDIGLFINFSQDHLDFHKTMENYKKSKLKLQTYCEKFFIHKSVKQKNFCKYGNEIIHVSQKKEKLHINFKFEDKIYKIRPNIIGKYQSVNVLSAIIALKHFFPIEMFFNYLNELFLPPGRMQKIKNIIIDFCHTLDGIKKTISEIKSIFKPKKLIIVIGCGGNRDSTKRPKIGKFLDQFKENVIITNDNPRDEDEMQIAKDIHEKCPKAKIILDRKTAIKTAINAALLPEEFVLIGGRGDETEQIFKDRIENLHDYSYVKELVL